MLEIRTTEFGVTRRSTAQQNDSHLRGETTPVRGPGATDRHVQIQSLLQHHWAVQGAAPVLGIQLRERQTGLPSSPEGENATSTKAEEEKEILEALIM